MPIATKTEPPTVFAAVSAWEAYGNARLEKGLPPIRQNYSKEANQVRSSEMQNAADKPIMEQCRQEMRDGVGSPRFDSEMSAVGNRIAVPFPFPT